MSTATKTRYRVEFDRIGRTHGLAHEFEARDGDEAAAEIFRFARRHLGSKWFDVALYEDGTGSIEAGRFGEFTWSVQS